VQANKTIDNDDPRAETLNIFNVVREKVTGEPSDFIEFLYEFWINKGFLTIKQEQALMKFYYNCLD